MTAPAEKPRRRGRPRAGEGDTREQIMQAAAEEFELHGYDGATMRAIAARAGVDAALIHHHFGAKADLFSAVVHSPVRPDVALIDILSSGLDGAGERIVKYIVTAWDDPTVRRRGVALLRATMSSKLAAPVARGFLSREVVGRIAVAIGGPEADRRAGLVVSQVAGLILTRYVIQLPALTRSEPDDLVNSVGATLQRYLTGDLSQDL
ncbi:TetR family transcriptional regulator [Microbacterium sp. NC79]|uniref:TetR/AcrR family transcriptional regulator n=1 Tax=Microbacterium sp. NC79 TaxID=2851009 RepID=UPI001C2B9E3F|nr:TetR family transcriptional regulator [Microbacterium sp. NC79]MBV0895700.1 TetR family transcriptional regulator [Microbacterium sp. NC79]